MAVYYILILVPMMMQHFTVSNRHIDYRKKNQRAIAFFFFFLTLLVMLRHESIGNDTRNYIHFFEKFSEMSWDGVIRTNIEPGFSCFNKIVSLFSKNTRIYLTVVAILISSLIYPTYKRLCKDATLTILIFSILSPFVVMFSGIRQMLAVAIGFIAYEFVRKNKFLFFIFTVCFATLFHSSAFMLFLMYPVYHARVTRKWLYIVVPVLTGIFIFNKQIFDFLNIFINKFTRFEGHITSTGAFTMLFLLILFAVFTFVIPDDSKLDKETIGLRNFLLLSLVIQMFAPLHSLAMRMSYYYLPFVPVLLPNIIRCRNERWHQVAIVGRYAMLGFFLIYFFVIKANSSGNLNVFPYHFFWENVG